MGSPVIDLTGHTYGRLTVLERAEECNLTGGRIRVKWVCSCVCGEMVVVVGQSLRNAYTRSCGCLLRESAAVQGRSTAIERPTYSGAHKRMRYRKGKATRHTCVDCRGPAEEWSYDHTDPNELTGEVKDQKGKPTLVAYSVDPAHYVPRCRPCHVRFDKGRLGT